MTWPSGWPLSTQHPLHRLLCSHSCPAGSRQPLHGHAEAHSGAAIHKLTQASRHTHSLSGCMAAVPGPPGLRAQGRGHAHHPAGQPPPLLGPFFLHLLFIVQCPQHPTCHCVFKNFHLCLALVIHNATVDPSSKPSEASSSRRHSERCFCAPWEGGCWAKGGAATTEPRLPCGWRSHLPKRTGWKVSGVVAAQTHWGQRNQHHCPGVGGRLPLRHAHSERAPPMPKDRQDPPGPHPLGREVCSWQRAALTQPQGKGSPEELDPDPQGCLRKK